MPSTAAAALGAALEAEDPHDTGVCDLLVHYLPWMLIAAMGVTATVSTCVVLVALRARRPRRHDAGARSRLLPGAMT